MSRISIPRIIRWVLLLTLLPLALFNCDALFDIAPPEIEIIEPQEGVTYSSIIPVELKVTDNSKVEKVEILLDGELVHEFTGEPFATDINLVKMGGGGKLKVVAHDGAGNWAESHRKINLVDEFISPPESPYGPDSGYKGLQYSYSTGGSSSNGGHSIQYRFDWGGGNYSNWSSSTSSSHAWSNTGTYSVKAQARCATHTGVVSSWSSAMSVAITIWEPVLVGSYDTPGDASDVFVSGSSAYVADGNSGLQIINVSNPASLALTGSYDTPGVVAVFVSGSYAFIAGGGPGLRIIDISNPATLTLVGSYNTPGSVVDVYVSGRLAYVVDRSFGLQIIDITNPASPTLTGSYNTDKAWDVFVSGSYAYVASQNDGLLIVDVSNPANPTLAGAYVTQDDAAQSVFVSSSYAYVADFFNGLLIINISNPASPILAGSYNTPGFALGVYVSGSYAFIADEESGLQIIDISNPASPTPVGSYNTQGSAEGVYVSANYAYVVDDEDLLIFDVSGLP